MAKSTIIKQLVNNEVPLTIVLRRIFVLANDIGTPSSLKKRQVVLVKGISLTNGNIIIVNYRARAKITFRLKRHCRFVKHMRQN